MSYIPYSKNPSGIAFFGTSPSDSLLVSDSRLSFNSYTGQLLVSGIPVSVSGHNHTISDITNFANSVSGLLPVKNILSGSGINVSNDAGSFTIAVTGSFGLTGEQVDDRVNDLLRGQNNIILNYDDNNNTLTISTSGLQPSGNYANANHTHVSSDIINFNTSVSGLISGIYQPILNNPVIGVGNSGHIARWTSNNTIGSGLIYDDLSTVYIRNLTSPVSTSELSISGYRSVQNLESSDLGFGVSSINFKTPSRNAFINFYGSNTSAPTLQNKLIIASSGGLGIYSSVADIFNPAFSISESGNIGIGKYNASVTLDVIGTGNFSQNLLINNVPVSISGHSHAASDIVNFNTSVSGLIDGIYAKLNSPSLTGIPTAPTAASGTNTNQIASTSFVRTEIANLVDSAPSTLDTLNELAAALGDDANFSTTVTNSLANKANLSGATFTGLISGPSGNFTSLTQNNVPVSVSGHTHISSDITDFNSSVSGLLPLNIATGIGSSGHLARWTSNNTIGSGLIYDDLSAVYITKPDNTGILQVSGTSAIANIFSGKGTSAVSALRLGHDTSSTAFITWYSEAHSLSTLRSNLFCGAPSGMAFLTGTTSINNPALYINSARYIGVGRYSPNFQLDVIGTGNFSQNLLVNNIPVSISGHTHSSANITNFNSSVSGLLPSIIGSGYVNSSFSNNIYTISVSGLQASGSYAALSHSHSIVDVSGLQLALDGKQPSGSYASGIHYHISSDITDFNSSVSGLLPVKNISAGYDISISNVSGNYTIASTNLVHVDSKQPQGFINRTDSRISVSGNIFTIAPTGSSYSFYNQGIKVIKTSGDSLTIPNITQINYIHFDTINNQLSNKTTGFDFSTDIPIAYVAWNSGVGPSGQMTFFAEERHGIVMDTSTHKWIHNTFGAQYVDGLSIGNYVLGGNGTSNSHATISIGNGTLYQEDIEINITDSSSTDPFCQELSPIAQIPVYYHQGSTGQWVKNTATNYPVKYGANGPQYNLLSGGVWTTPDVSPGGQTRYFAVWILATNQIDDPIISIMGQRIDSNQGSAENNNLWSDVNLTNLPLSEVKPLYRLIFAGDRDYTNAPKCSLHSILDIRVAVISTIAGVSQNDHGSLFGLGDDDHSQYVHIDNARTIDANHTFTNGLTSNGLISSSSGNFGSLSVNNVSVSISGHTHVSSDISNFNSSVSGLLPTISNSGNNRILTSTGSSVGINAEDKLTFDGTTFVCSGEAIIGDSALSHYLQLKNGVFHIIDAANNNFILVDTEEARLAYGGGDSVRWGDRQLVKSNNSPILDWSNGIVVGTGNSINLQNVLVIDDSNFLYLYGGANSGLISSEDSTINKFSFIDGLIENSPIGTIQPSSGNFSVLQVNGTGVTISGHPHSSSDITNFNTAVSGLVSGIYQPLLTNPVTGVGTSGYLSRWNGTNSITSGIIFDNGTSIGIGTTNTSGIFHIERTRADNSYILLSNPANIVKTHIGVGNSDSIPFLASTNNIVLASGNYGWGFFDRGSDGDFRLARRGGSTSWTDVLSIGRATGRVGIGTSTPSTQLHVVGGGLFSGDVTTSGSFIGGSGTAALPSFEFISDPDTGLFSPAANTFAISTSGVERLRADNIGRVGIGTTNPQYALDVSGSGNFLNGLAISGVPIGEVIDDEVAGLLVAGSGITLNYNDSANTLTVDTNVSTSLVAGTGISLSYNVTTDELSINTSAAYAPTASPAFTGNSTFTATTAPVATFQINSAVDAGAILIRGRTNDGAAILYFQNNSGTVNNGFLTGFNGTLQIYGGNYVGPLTIAADGSLTSQPTYDQTAAGSNVVVTSAGLVRRTSSSIKYKKNIEDLDINLTNNAIDNLRPVWYRSKNPTGDDKVEWSQIGLIAEEAALVEPRIVRYKTVQVVEENGQRTEIPLETPEPEDIDYGRLAVLLLAEIKNLKSRIIQLESQINNS